ncbi:hypothetical protein DERF_015915 [Dermatophagoides farinae]|uniref:Uncharacterized protein n=1 Tax=Dermatophagoides farinae TaxID=6954 RepID=A0A922KT69_DERFA|nr:hypothetical protein DERF_015915 [Dermatophagoides farinae]
MNRKNHQPFILRFMFNFLGCLGIQLTRLDWQKPWIIFGLLYRLTIFILFIHVLYSGSSVSFTYLDENYHNNAFLACFYMIYDQLYNLSYCIVTIYFFIYGAQIYSILNDDLIAQVYNGNHYHKSNRQSQIIFIILMLWINFSFIRFHKDILHFDQIIENWTTNIPLIFAYYTLYVHQFLPIMIYHYVKYATKFHLFKNFQLFQLQSSSSSSSSSLDLDSGEKLIQTVQSLAMINHHLDQMNSFNFFIPFIGNIIDCVVFFTNFQRNQNQILDNITYHSSVIIHLVYVLYLNYCIQKIINQIQKYLNNDHRRWQIMNIVDHRKRSIQIRLIEMANIYNEYFQMKIIQIFNANFSLLLHMFCFILTFCILIIQTTNS